ncbi:MAG: DUF6602 domain-containing protein [Opitutaceae bacterium]|jgi:hypothetical protein
MITTIADLLMKIMEKEKEVLARQPDLNHMPMLGDMYEGLARDVIDKAVFGGLNLKVVEGKIRLNNGKLSGQIDCIVAEGDGEKLPYTNHYIYNIENVIAIVEVKKTLYGAGLKDSFIHLRDVHNASSAFDQRVGQLIVDAWKSIVRKPYPSKDAQLSECESMIKDILIFQAHQPIRIVLGYDGYTSEFELREGFYNFIEKQAATPEKPIQGFGMASFPNQIICGKSSLVRLDGMPYNATISEKGFWPCMASTSVNPFTILLELLWTRLSYLYDLSSAIFGEDLESEVFNKFIDAKWNDEHKGWEYRAESLSKDDLSGAPSSYKWEPEYLTNWEFVVMNQLCSGKEARTDDISLIKFLKKHEKTTDDLVKSLAAKNLAGLVGNSIELLTQNSVCAIIPGGLFVAAENNTGRFSRWITKRMAESRASKAE